jgi:hypothetical protein
MHWPPLYWQSVFVLATATTATTAGKRDGILAERLRELNAESRDEQYLFRIGCGNFKEGLEFHFTDRLEI